MTATEITIGFIISLVAGYIVMHIPTLKPKAISNRPINTDTKNIFNNINDTSNEYEKELTREQNRKIRDEKMKYFIFYVISFLIIGASFYYPMFFNGLFKKTIYLSKTKLELDYIINKDNLFMLSTIYASILYVPILYLSEKIAFIYQWLQKNYHKFSDSQILTIRLIITVFFSVLLAAILYYILNTNISLWDSIKFTFSILLIPLLFVLNQ